jgi:hypothetical protein
MKTTYTKVCGCCESSGNASTVTITIDDEKPSDDGQPSWTGVCETCGPRLMIPAALYADLLAQHEAAVRVAAQPAITVGVIVSGDGLADPIVEAVREKLLARSRLGIAKYGVTLADSPEGTAAFLQHCQDELMDAANYLQRLMTPRREWMKPCAELEHGQADADAGAAAARTLERLGYTYLGGEQWKPLIGENPFDTDSLQVLCTLLMVSDPWPLDPAAREIAEAFVNRLSKRHGYESWIVAYNALPHVANAPVDAAIGAGFAAEVKAACEAYDADASKHGNPCCSTLAMLAALEAAGEARRTGPANGR